MRVYYRAPEEAPTTRAIEHPYKPGVYLAVHRRPMRLTGVDYAAADCCCFVTYRLATSEPLFAGDVGRVVWDALLEVREHKGYTLHAACLMPDHVHLLVSPPGNGLSVSDIVHATKLRQQRCAKEVHGVWPQWQKSFYDHVLGRGTDPQEEFDCVCWYIRQNPVRAGLVPRWTEYPFVL